MSWVADNIIDPFTGKSQEEAQRSAVRSAESAGEAGVSELRQAQDIVRDISQPAVELGETAGARLQSLLSGPGPQQVDIAGIVDFLRQEGFEDIQESAAARGRLGAGGTLEDLTRFSENLASTVAPQLISQQEQLRSNRFNELFNILNLGTGVSERRGQTELGTAANIANIRAGVGAAQGAGAIGSAQSREQGAANLINLGARAAGAFL